MKKDEIEIQACIPLLKNLIANVEAGNAEIISLTLDSSDDVDALFLLETKIVDGKELDTSL